MVVCDMSGAELRILAELSQDPIWVEAFKNKWDLHAVGAKAMRAAAWAEGEEFEYRCACGKIRATIAKGEELVCGRCSQKYERGLSLCEFTLKKDKCHQKGIRNTE